ncbi:TRM-domain-containing protein [Amniculicola lignicola CBS 123094]|uniref:tRNA (guanine(26)-N(2))-dimethyltransferase n=1 Tax=Amniculicola lignicola CBS 123094 TaxID=1392246 RepID=A0A6A5X0Y1_9PLEO|nr:TRM-domain-containing protein [Amniculicola lignicola CBS 123094]
MAAAQAMEAPRMHEVEGNTIESNPRAGQSIGHGGKQYTTIKEGLAHILVPHGIPTSTDPKMSKEESQKQQVFYNPIQQFNRDLSVLAIKTFGEDSIQRKIAKHEQAKEKLERAATRKEKKAQSKTAENPELATAVACEDDLGKRKREELDDGDAQESVATKKIRLQGAAATDNVSPTNGKLATSADAVDRVDSQDWKPQFTILDALSATGLRALRYAQEMPFTTHVVANDMSNKATAAIALNIQHNKLEKKITATTGNAIAHMYSFCDKKGYDVIDLDPYGTAAPFLDAAVQAIADEGLLCVTCTDSAIFASHGYLEKTYSQYGGLPLKGEPCHEGGLRLLLHAVASSAARYGMAIEPLLSLSIDYYIRVFIRVRKSPNDVKLLASKTMIVYHCDSGCGSWTTQYLARHKSKENKDGSFQYKHSFALAPTAGQHCQHCGQKTHLAGPMYGGPLHNPGFIERILAQLQSVDRETYPTMERIEGMLHTALEEITYGETPSKQNIREKQETKELGPLIPKTDPAELDTHPFFFIPSSISKVLHCQSPPLAEIRGALRHAGYRVTMSHCKPGSIRTDASWSAIWHILLEWTRQKAPVKRFLKEGVPGYGILMKQKPAPKTTENESNGNSKKGQEDNEERKGIEASKGIEAPVTPSYLDANFEVKFDEKLGRDFDRGKYVRYQLAPRENWGPMSRAK